MELIFWIFIFKDQTSDHNDFCNNSFHSNSSTTDSFSATDSETSSDSENADTEADDLNSSESEEHELDEIDYNSVYIDIARANASQQQCVICKRKRSVKRKLKRISDKAIIESYVKTGIMIQFGCRSCAFHFTELGFLNQASLGCYSYRQLFLCYLIFYHN